MSDKPQNRRSAYHLRACAIQSGVVALLVMLAGCTTLGPDYEAPETPLSPTAQWIDIDEPRVDSDTADLAQWWTVFDDPVLDALIDNAYAQNLTLRAAGLRILEARANLGIAIGSKYPQSQAVTGGAAAISLSDTEPDSQLVDENFNAANLSFDLGWELDFWGRFARLIESAEARLDASIADYDDVMVSLAAEVARAYVLMRTAETRLELTRKNVDNQQGALRIADVRFQNGAVTELDVQQARAVLNNTRSVVPRLETQSRQSRNALAVLLGLPPQDIDALLEQSASIPSTPREVSMGLPAELLRRRPDVRRAERTLAAQSALIGVAITDLYPRFSLQGSVGFRTSDIGADNDLDDLFDSDNVSSFIGPFFSWNILNYGRIKNNIRAEDARFQQLLVGYQNTVLSALAETENAIVAYLNAHNQAEFLAESVAAAERSVDLALAQYREGTTDFNRVITTLDFLFVQQDAYTATLGDTATSLIAMYKALGGGYESEKQRDITDYVAEEDKEDLRSRTKYWRKDLQ